VEDKAVKTRLSGEKKSFFWLHIINKNNHKPALRSAFSLRLRLGNSLKRKNISGRI